MHLVRALLLLGFILGGPSVLSDGLIQGDATGAISGSVVDASSGRPLDGAIVYLGIEGQGPVPEAPRLIADARGRFVFRHLRPAERYFIRASQPGYFDGFYGAKDPYDLGRRIALAKGQWLSSAVVELTAAASISGRVVDEAGDAVERSYVRAFRRVSVAGRWRSVVSATTMTDDRGLYRLTGLPSGQYYVSLVSIQHAVSASTATEVQFTPAGSVRRVVGTALTPAVQGSDVYPQLFYPAAQAIDAASAVQVDFGQEIRNIDFKWTPVQAFMVSGTVRGTAGSAAGLLLRLISSENDGLGSVGAVATTVVGADGEFGFTGVPPGDYFLRGGGAILEFAHVVPGGGMRSLAVPAPAGSTETAQSGGAVSGAFPGTRYLMVNSDSSTDAWTLARVSVRSDNVVIGDVQLMPTVTVSGRVVFETVSGTPPGTRPAVEIVAEPASGDPWLGSSKVRNISTSNEFVLNGLRQGRYVISAWATGWTQSSVSCGGRDCPDGRLQVDADLRAADVTVTLTNRVNELTGRVEDEGGRPVTQCIVLAFPTDSNGWEDYGLSPLRIRQAQVTGQSPFRIRGLPDGNYFVVALDPSQQGQWTAREFLQQVSAFATRASVRSGQTVQLELRMRSSR